MIGLMVQLLTPDIACWKPAGAIKDIDLDDLLIHVDNSGSSFYNFDPTFKERESKERVFREVLTDKSSKTFLG